MGGKWSGCGHNGRKEEYCGHRDVLGLDSINVSILVMILSYGFARCHHQGGPR